MKWTGDHVRLIASDVDRAVEFYARAFGAVLVDRGLGSRQPQAWKVAFEEEEGEGAPSRPPHPCALPPLRGGRGERGTETRQRAGYSSMHS